MPCRRGCSPPQPGPVCCCAGRCGGGGGRHRPHKDWQLCTTDTCSNPEFCITYRPQFCPNPPAPLNQEDPDTDPPQLGHWSDFPGASMPWPPHPVSSTPLHSHPSFSSQHSLSTIHQNGNHPYSAQAGAPRRRSTARISIGKPSLTRLDSDQNPMGLSGGSQCGAMRQRLASIGRPSLTHFDDLGCCQPVHNNFDESFPSPDAARVRYSDPRGGRAQPIGGSHQAQHHENAFENNPEPARRECECRMPPAFARHRCTGNLSGLCDCPDCDNK